MGINAFVSFFFLFETVRWKIWRIIIIFIWFDLLRYIEIKLVKNKICDERVLKLYDVFFDFPGNPWHLEDISYKARN